MTEQKRQTWLDRLYDLRRDNPGSHERPHKPVLLLAIMDLLDRGLITDNRIPLNDDLRRAFRRYFEVVRQHDDKPSIENPFYRLSGDGFWELLPKPGAPPVYQRGKTSGTPSMGALRETPGRFDQGLWELLEAPHFRHQLREALIGRYFPEHRGQLAALVAAPRSAPEPEALKEEFQTQRNAAFRHTVLGIYDFRCAACGIRVRFTDDLTLVQAAHIIPFQVSRNDKPNNGLALCPNHHWAMDRDLIAPCPDPAHTAPGIWKVSGRLDSRIEGQKDLLDLADRPVIEPKEKIFYPAEDSLRWREQRLSTKY
jgi:putative restriction endonuclease